MANSAPPRRGPTAERVLLQDGKRERHAGLRRERRGEGRRLTGRDTQSARAWVGREGEGAEGARRALSLGAGARLHGGCDKSRARGRRALAASGSGARPLGGEGAADHHRQADGGKGGERGRDGDGAGRVSRGGRAGAAVAAAGADEVVNGNDVLARAAVLEGGAAARLGDGLAVLCARVVAAGGQKGRVARARRLEVVEARGADASAGGEDAIALDARARVARARRRVVREGQVRV